MMAAFLELSPVVQAFLATCFTWFMTAAGAATVFVTSRVDRRLVDSMLGFAAGVMIAASVWSLLIPAIELSSQNGGVDWLPAAIGFLMGGATLAVIDRILPHLHVFAPLETAEGIPTHWQRSVLLVLAITLHNFPEGLAVGVAFGAAALLPDSTAAISAAIALTIGIGIQNLPEGLAVSMPLRGEGMSKRKAFLYGQASGMVEPVAGVLGALAVLAIQTILPYALAFAAGAMIFVVVEELIPESQQGKHQDLATAGVMLGFTVMMILDVALGA